MSIQEEIHKALEEVQLKINTNKELSLEDMEFLFLSSLIEEEAK